MMLISGRYRQRLSNRYFHSRWRCVFQKNALSYLSEHLDGEKLVNEYLQVVANRGLQAWELGSTIRKRTGLSQAVLNVGEWNFIALMKQYAAHDHELGHV